jgi:sugar phosphate isomerase/epimerase
MGLPTLPDKLDEGSCVWIAQMLRERGLTMAAISGTFNMVDPNASRLAHNLRRLEVLAEACRSLDTRIITLCTGSLDTHDMWNWHAENARKSTWERLVESMRAAVAIADRHEVTLAFEPEINNVVSSVMRARRLLDEIASPWLKVVFDPANLLRAGDLGPMLPTFDETSYVEFLLKGGMASEIEKTRYHARLSEAFDWLGAEIVLAHAKNPPGIEDAHDLTDVEAAIRAWPGPKSGAVADLIAKLESEEGRREFRQTSSWWHFYRPYLQGLKDSGFRGPLIIHGLGEDQVKARASFMRELLDSLFPKRD